LRAASKLQASHGSSTRKNCKRIEAYGENSLHTESRMCMLHQCEKCSGKDNLKIFLENTFSTHDLDADDVVKYKQWMHIDNFTTLIDLQKPVAEFVEIILESVATLCHHHFITKAQAKYLKDIKQALEPCQAIVLLDFDENYSFLIQDAVQGHHLNNSQATLHPFCGISQRLLMGK
jgi:hypothetical protein